MNRYLILLITVIIWGSLFLSGCEQTEIDSVQKIESDDSLVIWAWDENYNIQALEMAVEIFHNEYPDVEINIISMSQEESVAKLDSALVTGSIESLPDIVLIEDYRIKKYLDEYSDYFEDLSDLATANDFASYKTTMNQIDGKMYGIPFDSGVVGLFYRLDYIEAAGYSEEDMQNLTWEKYIEIGEKIKETTGKYMIALNPTDLPMIRMIMQSEGSWYTDENGNLNLSDNDILKSAIQVYKQIVDAGIAKPISDWNQFIKSFQDGETATVLSGSWISSSIVKMSDQSGKWRVAQLPALGIENIGTESSVGGSGWYVISGSGQEDLAKQFLLETFVSNMDLVNDLAQEINLVSALKEASECENYQKGVAFYGGQKIFQEMYSWTNSIPNVNYGDSTYEIEAYVADAIQNILSGEDITAALRDCENEYNQ